MYFITICTKNRKNYFAEIISLQTHLTEIGQIAHSEWHKTNELRPDMNLELGEFVVMPNHIHGIVIIGTNEYNSGDTNTEYKNQFAPQSKNLSSIIRGYKSAVTTYARKNNIEFEWQTRFHDHIIRTMDDYHRISNYIINNPAKLNADKFYNTNPKDNLK